jgi:hypothetical protein
MCVCARARLPITSLSIHSPLSPHNHNHSEQGFGRLAVDKAREALEQGGSALVRVRIGGDTKTGIDPYGTFVWMACMSDFGSIHTLHIHMMCINVHPDIESIDPTFSNPTHSIHRMRWS